MSTTQALANAVSTLDQATQIYQQQNTVINTAVTDMQDAVNGYLADASGQKPLIRLTPRQYGNLERDNLAGWVKNGFNISVSLYRTIYGGIALDERDAESQEILTAMGMRSPKHFFPNINVLRMTWSGKNSYGNYDPGSRAYTIYPGRTPVQQGYTAASYAKLVSGEIRGEWLGDGATAVNNQWGLCGVARRNVKPGRYTHSHPYAVSDSGEVLFIWPAVVSGYVPLDRDNPMWRWLPHYRSEHPNDVSI